FGRRGTLALLDDCRLLFWRDGLLHPVRRPRLLCHGRRWSVLSRAGTGKSALAHSCAEPGAAGCLVGSSGSEWWLYRAIHLRDVHDGIELRTHSRGIVCVKAQDARCSASVPLYRVSVASRSIRFDWRCLDRECDSGKNQGGPFGNCDRGHWHTVLCLLEMEREGYR